MLIRQKQLKYLQYNSCTKKDIEQLSLSKMLSYANKLQMPLIYHYHYHKRQHKQQYMHQFELMDFQLLICFIILDVFNAPPFC